MADEVEIVGGRELGTVADKPIGEKEYFFFEIPSEGVRMIKKDGVTNYFAFQDVKFLDELEFRIGRFRMEYQHQLAEREQQNAGRETVEVRSDTDSET